MFNLVKEKRSKKYNIAGKLEHCRFDWLSVTAISYAFIMTDYTTLGYNKMHINLHLTGSVEVVPIEKWEKEDQDEYHKRVMLLVTTLQNKFENLLDT